MTDISLVCPKDGEFIGYKKCVYDYTNYYDYVNCIVKLLIPADAKRLSAFGRKCRCSKAKVLGIFDLDGNELINVKRAESYCHSEFTYIVEEWAYPNSFDDNRFVECSNGIHFFMTFEEARDYTYFKER